VKSWLDQNFYNLVLKQLSGDDASTTKDGKEQVRVPQVNNSFSKNVLISYFNTFLQRAAKLALQALY